MTKPDFSAIMQEGDFALFYEECPMGIKDRQQGFDDGKNGEHHTPPHEQSPLIDLISPNSDEKIQSNKDYTEGWREGTEYREKNK